jgi:hypothetical protein
MVELLMAMALMTVCGAIFVGSMVGLNRSTGKAQAATNTATQTNQAYLVLDELVRSASVITTPAKSTGTGDWYVELRDTAKGFETCVQLRLDIATKQLQKRSWPAASPSAVTAWKPIADDFTNGADAAGSPNQPFVLTALTPTAKNQRLTVNLVATSGNPPTITTSRSSFTLTAANSQLPVPTGSICKQVTRP